MSTKNVAQHSVQGNNKLCMSNGDGKNAPSDTLVVSAAAAPEPPPTPITLTDEQKQQIRREQETIMERYKGHVLIYYRALQTIADKRAYKPPYKNLQDYLTAREIVKRTWHKNMNYVEVNELARDHMRQKCPSGHIPADDELLSKEKAKCFEGLKRTPHLLDAALNELTQNARPETIAKTLCEMPRHEIHLVTQKYKRAAEGEREEKLTAKDIGDKYADWFHTGDMLTSDAVKSNHYDMVICSPPYNLQGAVQYDVYKDNLTNADYMKEVEKWCARMRASLKQTGRACINVPNIYDADIIGKKRNTKAPYLFALPAKICEIMESFRDMHLYQWITWNRVFLTEAQDKHWGSYQSCKQPNARRLTETILVFAKGDTKRRASEALRDITESAFKQWTYDIWSIFPENGSGKFHKCAFPLEIPIRLMMLYGQRHDKILDPFGGSGTSALAAAITDRTCTSIDISPKYTKLARHRLVNYIESGEAKRRLEAILARADDTRTLAAVLASAGSNSDRKKLIEYMEQGWKTIIGRSEQKQRDTGPLIR